MTKDETLLVFTLVVSSVSVFLFGILLFMVLISATRDFRERTKSKLVKIMIWAGIVVITFAIAVRIYPIFIFLLKERIKPLVEALYDKLPWIWEVSLSRYWDRLIDFLDRYLWACAQRIQTGIRKQKGEFVVTFSCRVKKRLYARAIEVGIHLSLLSNLFWILKTTLAGFLGSFRLYLVYFGFYCLLFSGRWLRTSEDRGERQAQISGILLRGMLIQ
ncbi:hypothetical protein SETIT_J015800v2 [Setaria italica]|uniref:Uncharacterized protein n=1 Tax=Setaria italica TaxID=4555 RepID=K3Z2V9_SETIT|nr:hypothetical protein SETIT_J015800v2 [Setaria italica]